MAPISTIGVTGGCIAYHSFGVTGGCIVAYITVLVYDIIYHAIISRSMISIYIPIFSTFLSYCGAILP